jgi:hypothetical protein
VTGLKSWAILGVANDDVLLTVLDATPQQCEMVGFMLRRAVASRTALFIALFGARPECDQPDMKLIDVQMVKVRAALKKLGIVMRTEWGSGGWALAAVDKAKLPRLMIGEARDAIGWYHEKKSNDDRNIGLGPNHDWSSHGADSFGLMCIHYDQPDGPSASA